MRGMAQKAHVWSQPFGDLEVADVRRVSQELAYARMRRDGIFDETAAAQLGNEVVQVREPEEQIDFGHFRLACL